MNSEKYLFFLVIPPGFEDLARDELSYWLKESFSLDSSNLQIVRGGIEIELPLEIGFHLNHILKIPSQIRLRLARFRCKDFPKLHRFTKKIPWRDFLTSENFQITAASHNSRLKIKKRIEETVHLGIQDYLKAFTLPKSDTKLDAKIYVRLADDDCDISIDTSGEALFKRGLTIFRAQAPLRENLASGLLQALMGGVSNRDVSEITLIDPMCGSGTFLLEAFRLWSHIDSREFAYQTFPLFQSDPPIPSPNISSCAFAKLEGLDIDEKAVSTFQKNLKALGSPSKFHTKEDDLFQTHSVPDQGPNWIILNPPYGERLPAESSESNYFQSICTQIEQIYTPKRIGIIVPEADIGFSPPTTWILREELAFSNGGIPVVFKIFHQP